MMVLSNEKKKPAVRVGQQTPGREISCLELEDFQIVQDPSEKPNSGSVEAR